MHTTIDLEPDLQWTGNRGAQQLFYLLRMMQHQIQGVLLNQGELIGVEEAFQQAIDAEKVLLVFAEKAFINSAGLAVLFDLTREINGLLSAEHYHH